MSTLASLSVFSRWDCCIRNHTFLSNLWISSIALPVTFPLFILLLVVLQTCLPGGASEPPIAMEVEVKIRLDDALAHQKVAALLASNHQVTHLQENVFFDGAQQELSSKRAVLRLRFYNGDQRCVVTLKGKAVIIDGISRGSEVPALLLFLFLAYATWWARELCTVLCLSSKMVIILYLWDRPNLDRTFRRQLPMRRIKSQQFEQSNSSSLICISKTGSNRLKFCGR